MQRMRLPLYTLFLSAVTAGGLAAQSPYVSFTDRPIKALSNTEIQELREGAGMGYALAAELNRYPGPRHVLELADSLELNTEQRGQAAAILDSMSTRAQAIGHQLIEAEARLDSLFALEQASAEAVAGAVRTAALIEADLRTVHLHAHLGMRAILTEHQRQLYITLRGYGDGDHQHIHR